MLEGLTHWLQQRLAKRHNTQALEAALHKVIQETDPRLQLIPGYKHKLLPGLSTSLNYIASQTQELSPTLNLSLRGFTTDKRLGMFFSSPSSLLRTLRNSALLSDYFHRASNRDDAWGIMAMQRSNTTRLGLAMEKTGEVRSDVVQTVISFDNHELLMLCKSQQDLHHNLSDHRLNILIIIINHQLEILTNQRAQLENERRQLQAALITTPGQAGTVINATGQSLPDQSRPELETRLQTINVQLEHIKQRVDLPGTVDHIKTVLETPNHYFSITSSTIYLNRMGVLLTDATQDDATGLKLEEVTIGKDHPLCRAIIPIHITRHAVQELEEQFADELQAEH